MRSSRPTGRTAGSLERMGVFRAEMTAVAIGAG